MIHSKIIHKSNPTDLIKRAMHVASCYGFENIGKVISHQEKQKEHIRENADENTIQTSSKKHIKQSTKQSETDSISYEVVHALKTTIDNGLIPGEHPILIHQNNSYGLDNKDDKLHFGLIAIGMKKSIAEALIIKTALAILEDIGIKNAQVHINSIGDRDSSTKFINELNSYIRKNANSIPHQIRQSIKKDIFKVYSHLNTELSSSEEELPQSIKFLSDDNRKHFSDVLEYLEAGDITYEIDNSLVGDNNCYSHTLFEIRRQEEQSDSFSILAKGGRYDELVKRMFNIKLPTVGVILEFEKKGIKEKELLTVRSRKPKAYFIQLGSEAKKKSLSIIDILRRANIPTYHSLDNDKFGEQLSFARYIRVPYVIIMGHREALDDTVIVRDMETQFQNTILIKDLPIYLKDIHI